MKNMMVTHSQITIWPQESAFQKDGTLNSEVRSHQERTGQFREMTP